MNVNYVSYTTYIVEIQNLLALFRSCGRHREIRPRQSFTITNSLLLRTHTHASLVRTVYSYVARGSGGRRGRQPQVSRPGGLHPPTCCRTLFVPFSREPVIQQDHGHRPARNGQDRPGVLLAGTASARVVGSQRALVSDGREPVSLERS